VTEWCRHCGGNVRRERWESLTVCVHVDTGLETCGRGDGRTAEPTNVDPQWVEAAAKLAAEFSGRWQVTAQPDGFRASPYADRVWPDETRAQHAGTLDELADEMRRAEANGLPTLGLDDVRREFGERWDITIEFGGGLLMALVRDTGGYTPIPQWGHTPQQLAYAIRSVERFTR
jgi:hypothetical protein